MDGMIPVVATVLGFLVTWGSGFILIPFLRRLKFGQTILDIGPKWHKSKQGTPTMGGIMLALGFIVSLVGSVAASSFWGAGKLTDELKSVPALTRLLAAVGLAAGMGLIGFLDDYIKVVKKRNLGLTARQKTLMQLIVSGGFLSALLMGGMETTWLPFLGEVYIKTGIGLVFWPIALIFVYGFTNAVNLTDGLDGLASAVTLVVAVFFMLLSGYLAFSGTLPFVSVNIAAAALAGTCVGFLMWNMHPAKVFMGDTGSMFLGGVVVGLSFMIGRPVLLLLAGFIYLAEAFSVMIQVTYYKKTKKRIFKMTPIHHHFEMSGWGENKIVLVFCFVSVLGCAAAFGVAMIHLIV